MKRKPGPSEFGKHAFALELPSKYRKGILTQKACVSVRGALERDVFDGVLHRQKAIARLLNADVFPFFGAKDIVSKQDKLFVHQAQGSTKTSKLLKRREGHQAFLGKDFHLSTSADNQCCGWLTNKGRRIVRFVFPVDTGDDWRPLGDITSVTFKSTLQGREGLGLFVQERGTMNGHLLCLAKPRSVWQGARERTFLASEIVQIITSILSSGPFCLVQTVWVVATLLIRPNLAFMNTVVAPFEIAKCASYWRHPCL